MSVLESLVSFWFLMGVILAVYYLHEGEGFKGFICASIVILFLTIVVTTKSVENIIVDASSNKSLELKK